VNPEEEVVHVQVRSFLQEAKENAAITAMNKAVFFMFFISTFCERLSVTLGDSLQFVFLLDSITVRRLFRSVDQLISQALSNGFDVSESSLSCPSGKQVDGLVHTTERRHIDSLSTDSSLRSDASRVFTWTRINDSRNKDLDWVLVGKEVDDLECVLNDLDGLQLFTVVATVHHQRVDKSFNNGALCFLEPFSVISSSGVWKVNLYSLSLFD